MRWVFVDVNTPEVTFNEHAAVVRAERVQEQGDDSAVKLPPVVPSELAAGLRKSPSLGVQLYAAGGFMYSLKATVGRSDAKVTR